jgi:hypothetical protein
MPTEFAARRPRGPLVFLLVSVSVLAIGAAVLTMRQHPAPPPPRKPPAPVLVSLPRPSPPAQPEKDLRPALAEALGFKGASDSWARRVDYFRSQPADLTSIETDAVIAAMMQRCPPKVSGGIHSAYMHEIANGLQNRPTVRTSFVRALATIARDEQQDQVTRDYALQHLRQAWGRSADAPELRASIVSTFEEFAATTPALAASALLSLHLLGTDPLLDAVGAPEPSTPQAPRQKSSRRPPTRDTSRTFAIPDAEILPLLQPILAAKTNKDNITARMTAVRIAGERRIALLRPPLLAAISSPAEHTLVRISALNALGTIGDPADLKILAELKPEDPRVKAALQYVLNTMPIR